MNNCLDIHKEKNKTSKCIFVLPCYNEESVIAKIHADSRLMSNKVLNVLNNMSYKNIYLRGVIPQLNFKSKCVCYSGRKRIYGKSKYTWKKMLKLAFSGLLSKHPKFEVDELEPFVEKEIW